MDLDWNEGLVDQMDWHWRNQLRPRFDGLTDAEYFWEPVPECWNVHPVGESPIGVGSGDYRLDNVFPPPDPAPVTTIAWRLAHIIQGVLGTRVANHFGGAEQRGLSDGPAAELETFAYAGTAAEALAQLDAGYARWIDGVRGLGADGLLRPCGPAEGAFAEYPLGLLVLHINRETIHHGAEIALLRDLYLRTSSTMVRGMVE